MKERKIPDRYSYGLKYYCDEVGWCDPRSVVMEKPDDIPDPLRTRFIFTDKHEYLLKWLRGELEQEGKPKIKVGDALTVLSDVEAKDYAAVWEFIIKKRRHEIDESIKQGFSEKKIFLYNVERYPRICSMKGGF